jgi:hypothetical protein
MGKTILNRDEIEAMILTKLRASECGSNIAAVLITPEVGADGEPSFRVSHLRASGGPVLPDARRMAIAEAEALSRRFALRQST